jgi:tetratricopeptide (TPR) repeat protein
VKTIRLFFSSPGDVAEERTIAHRVVRRLEVEFAGAFRFRTVIWEREPLLATAGFQEQIERPADADVFVSIFWSRLGTPLPTEFVRDDGSPYLSGTEFEFEDALRSFQDHGKPSILVYRKTATPVVSLDEEEAVTEHLRQKKALDLFLARWFGDGGDGSLRRAIHQFASPGDFEELLEVHLRKLLKKMLPEGTTPSDREKFWTHGSPFRGLESFGFEHAAVYFGRTRAVASMIDALRRQAAARRAFVLVVAMSGGGKSSLVQAGVLPMLLTPGVVEGVDEWRRATLRPSDSGGRPLAGLARALCRDAALPELRGADDSAADLTAVFERDEFAGIAEVYAALNPRRDRTRRLVLVIDQLEELFGADDMTGDARERFMNVIDALARSGVVWIIATLRSDFYPRCMQLPRLMELKEGDGQFDLQPPTRPEIGQMIRLPAESAGLAYETNPETGERLDERIRDDTADNPRALPLLEFTLQALYEKRTEHGILTFDAYRRIGGLQGSLARQAEAVFKSLPAGVRTALPEVLDALAAPADGGGLRRKRAHLAAVANPDARTMIRAFVDARLFTAELGDDGDVIADVAHEALLDHWPRVLEWASVNEDTLRAHDRIATATRNWLEAGRSRDLLLQRGRPVAEARMLLATNVSLARDEREFINASMRRSRQLRLLRYGATASIFVFAVAAGIAAWLATDARDEAERRRQDAQELVAFMLGDLRERLEPIGRLDLLDSVMSKALGQLRERPVESMTEGERADLSKALRQIGQIHAARGDFDQALAAFDESLAMAQELHARDPDNPQRLFDLGNAWYWVGYIPYFTNDLDATEAAWLKYLETARRLVGLEPDKPEWRLELYYANNNLGAVETRRGQSREAILWHREAARLAEALARDDPAEATYRRQLAESLSFLSTEQENLGRYADALASRREAMQINDALVASDIDNMRWRNDRARGRFLYGELLTLLNDPAALTVLEQSVAELEELVEFDPANREWARDLCYAQTALAAGYHQFGRNAVGLRQARQAREVADTLIASGPDIVDWQVRRARALLQEATALNALGEPAAALSVVAEALERGAMDPSLDRVRAELLLLKARIQQAQDGPATPALAAAEALVPAASSGLNHRDLALLAELRLRSDDAEGARPDVDRLVAWGYRERDFIGLCIDKGLCRPETAEETPRLVAGGEQ